MKPSSMYQMETEEDGFLKLFLTKEMTDKLNGAEYEAQIEILKEFLKACNEAMARAWEQGAGR